MSTGAFSQWLSRNQGSSLFMERGSDILRARIVTALSTAIFRLRCAFFGFRFGRRLQVYGWVILNGPAGSIELGNSVILVSSSWRCSARSTRQPRSFADL